MQYAIENNQTLVEIEAEVLGLCDALPEVGPSQTILDCDKLDDLPDITFTFADNDFTLSATDYVLRVRLRLRSPENGMAISRVLQSAPCHL